MNRKIPFVQSELNVAGHIPGFFGGPERPVRNTPVTSRENICAMYFDKEPFWLSTGIDNNFMIPSIYNNNLGRGMGADIVDSFGITWKWEPTAGGSIVVGGNPLLKNVNDWKDVIKFPDIDSWDWAGQAALEENKIDVSRSCEFSFVNGFLFERLISYMDFMPAAMALVDDDQTAALHELFGASAEFACKLVDKFCEYWPRIDGFNIHDDWGSQKAPFFSKEIADELFVPYMKILNDHIKSKGRYVSLHSCGHNFTRVQCFIDAGFDSWGPQLMNDTHALYEQFGDKIIIGVVPDPFDPETTSEEEQRERAKAHVDKFCKPGKPSMLGGFMNAPVFADALYEYSRKKYLGN